MADKKLPPPPPPPPITLFCYPGSVYSRRISWYLDLRRIPYSVSIQPPMPPRPLLSQALRLRYRRIPVVQIAGATLLCDSRLILAKLDRLFPGSERYPALLPMGGAFGVDDGAARGLARVLEAWMVDGGVFGSAVGLMTPEMPMCRDPKFVRDREELAGVRLDDVARVEEGRPKCRAALEAAMGVVEGTWLADGREWVLGPGPSLVDLQAVWVFDWVLEDPFLRGALGDEEEVRKVEERFPRTVAWVRRWRAALKERGAWDPEREGPRGNVVSDEEVLERVFGDGSVFVEDGAEVVWDEGSARVVGLEKGQVVEVFPTDYGSAHKDRGRLVGLGLDEVVIDVDVEERGKVVRLHFPRTGFCVRKV